MTRLDTRPAVAIAPVTQWFNLAGGEFPVYAGKYECRYVTKPQNIMLMMVVIAVNGGLRITVGEPFTYRYYDTNNMMCVAFGVLDDAIEWRGLADQLLASQDKLR